MTDSAEPTLVRQTGLAYFPIALVARLPFAMMVVGVLTLVVSVRGSLSLGGVTSAAAGLGTAIFGPFIGAAADRWGQRPVLLLAAAVNSVALCAMAWIVYAPVADAAVLAVAFAIGATAPQVSPMSRSRLVGIITQGFGLARRVKVLGATMAYESAADEIVFVFGPVLVGVLATAVSPAAPVVGAAALAVVFVTAFALHRTARTTGRHAVHGAAPASPARELARPLLLVTLVGTLGMGLFFGATLTALTSFMTDRGVPEQAGLVYGAMGLGSAALALAVAAFPARFALGARWLVFGGVLLAGAAALPLAHEIVVLAVLLVVMGLGVGPTLVTLYHLAAQRSPTGRSATVMTMLGSAIVVGQATASAVTGVLAQADGTAAAVFAPMVAAAVVFAGGVGNVLLSRRPRAAARMSS